MIWAQPINPRGVEDMCMGLACGTTELIPITGFCQTQEIGTRTNRNY